MSNKSSSQKVGRPHVPIEERFWKNVSLVGGCSEWIGCRNTDGYGVISEAIGGKQKQYRTHRLAYALSRGVPIARLDGVVMHSCDNPPCCTPEHLSLGTSADNTADRHRKGRDAKGDTNASRLYPGLRSGERNGRAKLTAADATDIRSRYARGHVSQQSLATEFGVSQYTVSAIVLGKLWKMEL